MTYKEAQYAFVPEKRKKMPTTVSKIKKWTLVGIILLSAALVYKYGFTENASANLFDFGREYKDIDTDYECSLDELEKALRDYRNGFAATAEDINSLARIALEYPEYKDRINFFIENMDCYDQTAVNSVLLSPEKLDFVLLSPLYTQFGDAANETVNARKGTVPYLVQYDSRWAFHPYGSSCMGNTACGPVCLSMAALGLTGDSKYSPVYVTDFAANSGYYMEGTGTAWSLFTDGAAQLGLSSTELPMDESAMRSALSDGKVIIASMTYGDFTYAGHFIVIHDCDGSGFKVYDPSSMERSRETWSFDDLNGQTAVLWALSEA